MTDRGINGSFLNKVGLLELRAETALPLTFWVLVVVARDLIGKVDTTKDELLPPVDTGIFYLLYGARLPKMYIFV